MDSSLAPAAAPDVKKGLLIDKGKEGAGDLSPEPEKPSRRRHKVKEGAAKADVRRPPSARCQNRKAPSDSSSEPKKPRVSAEAAASEEEDPLVLPPGWWEREYEYMFYDYEKREREEMEKAVAEEVQFIQRWIDFSLCGRRRRPHKPEENAPVDPYLSKPPSGSYSDETIKRFLDFKIQDHHLRNPNFLKSYLFKLKKEHGYSDDRSKDSDRDETTLSQIEPGPFPLIGETSKKTRGSNDPLEENS